jgi:hypothetical protein
MGWGRGVAQMLECLPSLCKALSSTLSTASLGGKVALWSTDP